jgi:choloylglycine hydrolase
MDLRNRLQTDLWAFPRGLERGGAVGDRSLHWTSRYGSVVAAAFGAATVDGLNEEGLAANFLYLTGSEYPDLSEREGDAIAVSGWTQYMFATVGEAVAAMRADPLLVATGMTPDGMAATVHLSLSDATGDSAVIEFIDGEMVIHHSRDYRVMTNEPAFDKQLTLNEYWRSLDGTEVRPGTNKPVDRFVRASFYIDAIPKTSDPDEAVTNPLSVIRNVSVPRGISTPDCPNISRTLWRIAADHTSGRYVFDSATRPNVFRVDLSGLDFSEGAASLKLDVADGTPHAGEVSRSFAAAEPYAFLPADAP